MTPKLHFQHIGEFVVLFQNVERLLTELLVHMTHADDEFILILVSELEFSQRVKKTDVMFSRFVELYRPLEPDAKRQFHELMKVLVKLGERRNDIVHSGYFVLLKSQGESGLLRQNSKLRAGKGARVVEEEDFAPKSLTEDIQRLSRAQQSLEEYREKVIEWLYPD